MKRAAASGAAAAVLAAIPAGAGTATPDDGSGPPLDPRTAPPVDSIVWQQLALDRDRELRRARRLAARRLRQLRRLRRAMRQRVRLGGASGLERGFLCIHGHEGAWRDGGAPYWGGLQMDLDFQAHYGGEFLRAFGPADSWTPAMQIAVAERAYLTGRGWHPWPNTARACGLLP